MLGKQFEETASTVGAVTDIIQTHTSTDQESLERFAVENWKVYEAVGDEFDRAMSQRIAQTTRRFIELIPDGNSISNLDENAMIELLQKWSTVISKEKEADEKAAAVQLRELILNMRSGLREAEKRAEGEKRKAAEEKSLMAKHGVDSIDEARRMEEAEQTKTKAEERAEGERRKVAEEKSLMAKHGVDSIDEARRMEEAEVTKTKVETERKRVEDEKLAAAAKENEVKRMQSFELRVSEMLDAGEDNLRKIVFTA
jgi:hypothetical protein